MPQYLIERDIPGAGKLTSDELKAISAKSNGVLRELNRSGKDIQWVHSYVTGDKIFCVYNGPSADVIRVLCFDQSGFEVGWGARVVAPGLQALHLEA